jgi:hypothetical protein
MGFFGLGRRSTTTRAKQAPVPVSTSDKLDLAATAVRGADPAARSAALGRLLADPQGQATQLAIVAVQDAEGQTGLLAVAVLQERKHLKTVAKKAKTEAVRQAAAQRMAELDAAARKPSEEKARAARLAALEALVPRATRLAVGNGTGAQEAWAAIAAERDAILAQHAGLAADDRIPAIMTRLEQLAAEVQTRIAEAQARLVAEQAAAAELAQQRHAAAVQLSAAVAADAAVRSAPAPEGFPAVVARAEELAAASDPEAVVDEFLRLHKDALRLGDALDPAHELRVRFATAWEGHRQARRQARQDYAQRRAQAQSEIEALVGQAEALATAADGIAPDDAPALSAQQQALDALRDRFRTTSRMLPPGEIRSYRERFQASLDDGYAPLRAAREAADAESFANLVRAEQLKDEIEALPVDTDPAAAFRGLRDCQARWRRLGPMPRIKARSAWDAFRAAGDACFERLKPWLAAQDQERQAALARREELCVEAEQVLARPAIGLPGSPAERDARRAASQRMQELQRAWRESGEVPRGMDRALWERFKKAQDGFWERHKADLDAERERREATAADAEAMVAGAEAFAADAEKAMTARTGIMTAADVQRRVAQLRERWRSLPPIPRDALAALDARFGAAIDRILATIRDKLDSERAALEAAATKRRTLLTELEEILAGENPRWQADAVDRIKQQWREAGRVPAEDRESLDRRFAEMQGKWRSLATQA